jgi:hypothetical protein
VTPSKARARPQPGTVAAALWAALLVVLTCLLPVPDDTGLWLLLGVVAICLGGWAALDLAAGRRARATPRRRWSDAGAAVSVGLLSGAITGAVWRAVSSCQQQRAADDPMGSCGEFVILLVGPFALVGAGAGLLALARVRRGWAVAVAAGPVTFGGIQFYRAVTHSGAEDPAIWALAGVGGVAALVCWLAASPYHHTVVRLVAATVALAPLPLTLVVA